MLTPHRITLPREFWKWAKFNTTLNVSTGRLSKLYKEYFDHSPIQLETFITAVLPLSIDSLAFI